MREYPSLFGVVSLGTHINHIVFPSFKEVFHSQNIRIFSTPDSEHIHTFKEDSKFIAINGAVYSPVLISSEKRERNNFSAIFKKDPTEIDGNFVLLKVTHDSFSIISDKFGSRLLLYCIIDKKLFFATNIFGLKVLMHDEFPTIDERSLIHYYHFGFTESDKTLLKGIYKLPAGNVLSVKNKEISRKPYFNLLELKGAHSLGDIPEEQVAQKINTGLSQSIERRSSGHSVIPVAVSGGVDSGFILKHLVEQGKQVRGYNLAYQDYYDEHDRIDEISGNFGIQIKKIVVNEEDLLHSLQDANSISSEPIKFNDAAMRLVALESKRDGFKTLWDGDGADRLFFGMNRQLKYINLFKRYNQLNKFKLIPFLKAFLSLFEWKEITKLKTLLHNWENNILPYPERKMLDFYDEEIEKTVFEMFVQKYLKEYLSFSHKYDLIDYFTYQSIKMCPEMFFYPPSELQSAIGLTPVSPYWDDEVVKMALNIPKEFKIKDGYTKYILRKAAALNGDKDYWMKPKIGLQSAYQFVLESETGKKWKDEYVRRSLETNEYSLIKDHLKGNKVDLERLIFLELWKEKNEIY